MGGKNPMTLLRATAACAGAIVLGVIFILQDLSRPAQSSQHINPTQKEQHHG